ncbi:Methionine--tRNA ligase, mitochondrial [Paramarasmius palmivorus]|uniref:Methionine--tRNA ligase, mitochondrial n=1 Tax=Paramarasmius palmivorus TaxID=297713 RepID=A0AAW0BTS1_9AGAR
MPEPKIVIQNAQEWCKARFNDPFKFMGKTSAHGIRKDFIPATINTIAHGIFDDRLWKPEERYLDRLSCVAALGPNPKDLTDFTEDQSSTYHRASTGQPQTSQIAVDKLPNPDELQNGLSPVECPVDNDMSKGSSSCYALGSPKPSSSSKPTSPVERDKGQVKSSWNALFNRPKAQPKKRAAEDSGKKAKRTKTVPEPSDGFLADWADRVEKSCEVVERNARERTDSGI